MMGQPGGPFWAAPMGGRKRGLSHARPLEGGMSGGRGWRPGRCKGLPGGVPRTLGPGGCARPWPLASHRFAAVARDLRRRLGGGAPSLRLGSRRLRPPSPARSGYVSDPSPARGEAHPAAAAARQPVPPERASCVNVACSLRRGTPDTSF